MATFELFGHTITMRLADEVDGEQEDKTALNGHTNGALHGVNGANGTPDPFDERLNPLFEHYRYWLVSIAMQGGLQRHDAEDLVQDTYLLAREKYSQLRDPECITGWIRTIIINRSRNMQSRNRMEFFSVLDYNCTNGETLSFAETITRNDDEDVIAPIINAETREVIASVLKTLDALSREAIQDFYLDGLRLNEIVVLRGIPLGTAKRRLHDARHRLRGALINAGYTKMDFIS